VVWDYTTIPGGSGLVKKIELTQGQVAIVDDVDFEFLHSWKWYAHWDPALRGYYAVRKEPRPEARARGEQRQKIYMHRVVAERMGLEITGLEIDHIDRMTLNNQRFNLRVATRSQNSMNTRAKRNGQSRFKGVSRSEARDKWQAHIRIAQHNYYLGLFTDEAEAARYFDMAAANWHRDFAVLNLPDELPEWCYRPAAYR